MSVATLTHPRLAVVATEARQEARAQKRENSSLRKVARGFVVTLAILFATLGLGAGTAQAWPWSNMQEDITAFVTNFCGPEDVPPPQGHQGMDNLFGLNTGDSDKRGTIMPNTAGLGKAPLNGLDRISQAYDGQANVISPTYERYGMSTLQWDSFGAGCFAPGYWFTPIANVALHGFVVAPIMFAMATLQLALGNMLYTVFTGVISPFVSIFTLIFKGWALWLAPIGIVWAFIRSKGNLREVAKTGAWILMIFGVLLWMGNNTSTVVTKANNFVTEFASSAANQINEINGVSTGSDGTAVSAINQSLWYGVPYQTWLEGQVGPQTAAADRTRVTNGEVSWGAVILNSKYVGNDDQGREVRQSVNTWNTLSYSPNESFADQTWGEMQTKPGAWTKNKIWEKVPYLFNVKALCGDTSDGVLFTSSSGEKDNKWFYGGSCDAASAGTADMVPYFTGTDYNSRLATAMTGGFAALAVCLAVAAASIYLGVQKMLFYFLLLFGPVFLTIAMFGDQKRAAFAKRYFELMIGNLLKQGVAVLVVLFIANAMSMLLYPPADEQFAALRAIPWMLKPTLALFFLIGLAMFLLPLKRIVTGAVKGDTKVVDKTAQMPVDAAKTAAKVGAAATVGVAAVAAVVATGGAAAPVLGKVGGMAMSAGRMAGGRGGVGKVLTSVGRGANLASRVGGTIADSNGKKAALSNLAQGVFSRDKGVQEDLKKIPGALDKDGKMTPKGQAIMANAIKRTGKQGEQSARAEALQKSYMDKFYKGHLASTGKHHAMDPNSPENLRAAQVAKEQDRLAVKEEAKHSASRSQNTGEPTKLGPNGKPTDPANDGTTGANANGTKDKEGFTDATKVSAESQAASAEKARENVSGPGFARDENVKANVTVDGDKVVEQMGLSKREIAQDPSALITGTAYDGGDTSKMDPRHPATASMNDLKFAMLAGDQQGIESASMRASEAISQHGVPGQVSSVSAASGTPEGMATAINAMPVISEDTPWQVRAEGATTMQAALSLVPEDSPAHEPMTNYVAALSNPTVSASTVEGLKSFVIESEAPEIVAGAPEPDMTSAIRESAERVSVAPAAVVEAQGVLFGEPEQAPQASAAPAPAPVQASAPSFAEPQQSFGDPEPVYVEAQPSPVQVQQSPQSVHVETQSSPQPTYVESSQSSEPAFFSEEGSRPDPVAHDLFGTAYYNIPEEAVDAMPRATDAIRRADADPALLDQYRSEMEHWRDDYDILPPSSGGGDLSASTPRAEAPSYTPAPAPAPAPEEGRHSSGAYPDSGPAPTPAPAPAPASGPAPVPSSSAPARDEGPGLFSEMLDSFIPSGGGNKAGSHSAPPPEDLEEISGMPTENREDNSESFRRTKRKRISGFYDMEDDVDSDDETKGGE